MINMKLWQSSVLSSHLKDVAYATPENKDLVYAYSRLEPRTRSDDYQKALSFEVYDPLWMLGRQWQFGRFKAVDCGTPVMLKMKTEKRWINQILRKNKEGKDVYESYSTEEPMEYEVERQNAEITPYVCVESAIYLKKKLLASPEIEKRDFAFLYDEYKLSDVREQESALDINALKMKKNRALSEFYNFYMNRAFDGYRVYKAFNSLKKDEIIKKLIEHKVKDSITGIFADVLIKYAKWFKNKFEPCSNMNYWNSEKLGYEVKIKQDENTYTAEDYDSGKLSWYSFDFDGAIKNTGKPEEKMLSYIPTPAKISGAPANRLWEFENRKVDMGNGDNDFNFLGTAAIMQYVTMFSNDWMIVPLETETGTVLDVQGIVVKDSFGDRYYIDRNAQMLDNQAKGVAYTDRWDLFGTSYLNAYHDNNFSTSRGLLFPPTVLRCEEGRPIEEVQFLRDEMANMVWGVETTINNLCGGTMDGRTLSDEVFSEVDEFNLKKNLPEEQKKEGNKTEKQAEYSLLIQNRVPLNWIPFIPEQLKKNGRPDCRNIALRRGRMPIYYDNKYQYVTPATDLIGCKYDENGGVKPLYINEEEIATCGIKIKKTAQRTRWFYGKSFNWIGNREIISEYQANSGLLFDELISSKTGKAIKVNAVKDTPSDEGTQTE